MSNVRIAIVGHLALQIANKIALYNWEFSGRILAGFILIFVP